jgi:hypothetical protein
MYYKAAIGGIDFTETCGYVSYGEIEDYCVYLSKANSLSKTFEEESGIALYPNPAHDLLCIAYDSKNESALAKLDIYDTTGRLLHSEGISGQKNYIDVSTWPRGMYLIKVQNQETHYLTRLIIQ